MKLEISLKEEELELVPCERVLSKIKKNFLKMYGMGKPRKIQISPIIEDINRKDIFKYRVEATIRGTRITDFYSYTGDIISPCFPHQHLSQETIKQPRFHHR